MRGIGPIESVQLKLHDRSGWHTVAKVLAINAADFHQKGPVGRQFADRRASNSALWRDESGSITSQSGCDQCVIRPQLWHNRAVMTR